ncbi:MAG: hypothetical protein EXR49_03615 [Dehalococcoidia bacterium]|nr:hypothetical protein [Dehalococcoidia bacterium]
MKRVTGVFNAELTVPISLKYGFNENSIPLCQFEIDSHTINIVPSKIEPPFQYGGGEWEPPKLVEVIASVTMPITISSLENGDWEIGHDAESDLERVFIRGMQRFVSAVRSHTGDWKADTRHPIRVFSVSYLADQVPVKTTWHTSSGSLRMPSYAMTMLSMEFIQNLSEEKWHVIAEDVKRPIKIPSHQGILYDARAF